MTDQLVLTVILLFILFFLLGSGVWIGLALIGVGAAGIMLFDKGFLGANLTATAWESATTWSLTALPLFIWMGEILYRTRLSEDMFRGLSPWMAGLPGGLLHTNVAGCTLFAAVSGSSAATLLTVGKMSLPELKKRGYPEYMTVGTLAGSATLGLMIPPSLTLIVYGVTTSVSIIQLFMAGILPGLVLAALFSAYIAGWHFFYPSQRPAPEPRTSLREKLWMSRFLIPVLLLVFVVIGSMYGGFATATEAAAVGVTGALLLAAFQRSLTLVTFWQSLLGATRTSAMVAFILMGSSFLSLSMGYAGLPATIATWIGAMHLPPVALIAALVVFYIIIGMFLDGISAVVLTMAVIQPMISQPEFAAQGFNMVWFGIFVVVVVEMAQITPPVGFNLFVMQAMTGREMGYIAWTALPMFLLMILMVGILVLFPDLATYLPVQAVLNAKG